MNGMYYLVVNVVFICSIYFDVLSSSMLYCKLVRCNNNPKVVMCKNTFCPGYFQFKTSAGRVIASVKSCQSNTKFLNSGHFALCKKADLFTAFF
jgi:hypothetical protein